MESLNEFLDFLLKQKIGSKTKERIFILKNNLGLDLSYSSVTIYITNELINLFSLGKSINPFKTIQNFFQDLKKIAFRHNLLIEFSYTGQKDNIDPTVHLELNS